jgi:class 3 adenylate cyclase/tetratricopeptide (TPR) repeat protein
VICPVCSSENESGSKFCNECGSALASGCPNCGAQNKPGAKFCNECGTNLVPEATATAPVSPPVPAAAQQAERKLVTVLFADIVGFTPFAEDKDAEEVRDTLSRYFDLCSAIVGRYGGTIEKFIGDAVMAVWGAPVAFEDDAERAVRAALELVASVGTIAPDAQARAGVLTGEAAVTLGATNQGMVAGDLVNTAARLQAVAEPGAVLTGESTMLAATGAIVFEQAGDQHLKGKESPVPAWRAMRVVAERGGRNRSDALEAPFVGRADELRLLKDLLDATGREKRSRLVSVMGPAGIGKSRLAWELLKYIDGLVETIYWHSGRSPSYGEGITFWALGEMVRGRCQLVEDDDEDTTRLKVRETVATFVAAADQRPWIESSLLTLLGFESGLPPDQLFAAWRMFFEAIAQQGTVALVFEDLHHADSGTVDFIEHLLDWSRGAPLYVVTLARPDFLDRRSDWGAGKRNFSSIFLEPLPDDQMRELIAGLAPGLPDAAAQTIVERADGIPLYAVETVRMLLAEGRLREEEGIYVPVGDLTTLSVPDTLTALISSRLDALEPRDRTLIHDAAVLGQSFTAPALAAVSGLSDSDLQAHLDGLIRRELIGREIDARSPERGQYAFVQALIREVAYKKDRKARHLAAARFFEGVGSDELASALANHYLAAHENSTEGDEADALAAQARIALKAAADRALNLGANDQAVRFAEQALAITPDPAEQAELHLRAADAAHNAANYDLADSHYLTAIDQLESTGNRTGAAKAIGDRGWSLLDARHTKGTLEMLQAADREYSDVPPDGDRLYLDRALGRAFQANRMYPEAVAKSDEILAVAERTDNVPFIAYGLIEKGGGLANLGRLREGLALIRAAEDLARTHNLSYALQGALLVGGTHSGEIDLRMSVANYREALALAKRSSDRGLMLLAVNNYGYVAFLAGDWDGGLAELESSLSQEMGPGQRIWLMSNVLNIRACRGEDITEALVELDALVQAAGEQELRFAAIDPHTWFTLARAQFAQSRELNHESASTGSNAPYAYYAAARSALWAGDLAAARADFAALDATGFHGRVVETRRHAILAGIAALEGREAEAIRTYEAAIANWHELGMVWDEALTCLDMAITLDASKPQVQAAAANGRQIMERLMALPFIEKLDAVLAEQGLRSATNRSQVPVNPVVVEAR